MKAGRMFAAVVLMMLGGVVFWWVRGPGATPPTRVVETEAAPSPSPAPPTPAARPSASAPAPQPSTLGSARSSASAGPPGPRDVGDEARTMTRIRDVLRPDPKQALALIDAADRAYPAGPFAEERAALRIDALVYQNRIGIARDAAEAFYLRYPRSTRAEHIETLTGAHPRSSDPDEHP